MVARYYDSTLAYQGYGRGGPLDDRGIGVGVTAVRVDPEHLEAGRPRRPGGVAAEDMLLRRRDVAIASVGEFDVEVERGGGTAPQLEAGERVDLVRRKAARVRERHRPADVVVEGRREGPVAAHRRLRTVRLQGTFAARELRPTVDPLAEGAVTGGAFLGEHLAALIDAALAGEAERLPNAARLVGVVGGAEPALDVFLHGPEPGQVGLLGQVADAGALGDDALAGVGVDQSGSDLHQVGLAGPIAPDKADAIAKALVKAGRLEKMPSFKTLEIYKKLK